MKLIKPPELILKIPLTTLFTLPRCMLSELTNAQRNLVPLEFLMKTHIFVLVHNLHQQLIFLHYLKNTSTVQPFLSHIKVLYNPTSPKIIFSISREAG